MARPARLFAALTPAGLASLALRHSHSRCSLVERGLVHVARSNRTGRKKALHTGRAWDMARPARFERATAWFVARYSIQLSYGRFEGCEL